MKIKFRLVNYAKFSKKIIPVSILWHLQQWSDKVTSKYYGRYGPKKGTKKDLYYLAIDQTVYILDTVEDLINLDHDLYLQRMQQNGPKESGNTMEKGINYCSICAHKDGCPFLSFAYQVRKKACLFIPIFHQEPTGRMELDHLKPAESKLITEVVMTSIYAERVPEYPVYEDCAPITVYKHTFTFSQLQ